MTMKGVLEAPKKSNIIFECSYYVRSIGTIPGVGILMTLRGTLVRNV